MKVHFLLGLILLPILCHSYPYPTSEDKSLSLEDTDINNEHSETVKDSQISKRSGSFDYVAHLKSGLLSGIGHASASIASGSSGKSSGGGDEAYKSHSHEVVVHGNSVEYDPWSFKKSVLNTIFQAVKAITGGVTALKGQLIKGSGYALSASGNLVAAGGEKVTDVGKSIINSAHINSHTYSSAGSGFVHPFAKLSSLSGASSSGSSGSHGNKHAASVPVVHTETITTYEIPSGHSSYGPPTKPPTYSSATHQYLPPAGASYTSGTGGGAPFTAGHAAFEAPQTNYLPSAYTYDSYHTQEQPPAFHQQQQQQQQQPQQQHQYLPPATQDDFNIYGRHKKLTDDEARKAAAQLQEILNMLPDGKTEYTASKTVALDTSAVHTAPGLVDSYGLPANVGQLESLSHTESITAAYVPRPQENAADIYHQMAKKQSPEEIYIQNHPNEGYDYTPPKAPDSSGYKYENYHANKSSALKDLTPIIAALDVAKRKGQSSSNNGNINYAIEKNVHKVSPFQYLPPVVQKSKYTFQPSPMRPNYGGAYKVRRHVTSGKSQMFRTQDYEIQDPLIFNRMLEV